jgi:MFS family permease
MPSPHGLTTTLGALRALTARPALLRLVLALGLRWGGSWAAMVAYLVVAYQADGPVGVAAVGIVRMLPAAILAPVVGALGERAGHERLLVGVYVMRASATTLAALAVLGGLPLWVVLACAGTSGAVGALLIPLHTGLLPSVAQTPHELVAANVASSVGEGIATILGPAVGGLLLVAFGPGETLATAAAIAALATILAASAHATVHQLRPGRRPSTRAALRAGLDVLRDRPGALIVIGAFGAQTFVRGLLTTLIVVLSIGLLGLGTGGVGALNACLGLGGLVGAMLILGRVEAGHRWVATFLIALAGWGFPIAVIGIAPGPLVAFLALAAVGVSNAAFDVAGYTLLQRTVPAGARTAVLGLTESVVALGVACGSFISPLLIHAAGPGPALIATGAILPILAVVLWGPLHRVPDIAVVPEHELVLLQRVPLFAPLPLSALEELARSGRAATFAPDVFLMREGQPGDRFWVLDEGSVEVTQRGRRLRVCGPGEGVGEIALLRRVPRTASVQALTPVVAYGLDAEAFLGAVTGHAIASAAAESLVSERLVESRA